MATSPAGDGRSAGRLETPAPVLEEGDVDKAFWMKGRRGGNRGEGEASAGAGAAIVLQAYGAARHPGAGGHCGAHVLFYLVAV